MRYGLVLACVVGGLLAGMAEGQQPASGPVLDKATAAEVRKLQEQRRDLLRQALEVRVRLYQAARAELGGVIETSERLLAAEVDLAATNAERIGAHERHLKMARTLVEVAKARHDSGRGHAADLYDAQASSLQAQIGLLKAGGRPKNAEQP